MTKDELKQEIIENIKPNARREITGQKLQDVLLDSVDVLGTESDPVFMASPASSITDSDITTWDGYQQDISELQQAYAALTQSDVEVVASLPASGQPNTIYRVVGVSDYSDYMWDGTTWVLMATYNNAIDQEPTEGSPNLVTSGGVFQAVNILDEAINGIPTETLNGIFENGYISGTTVGQTISLTRTTLSGYKSAIIDIQGKNVASFTTNAYKAYPGGQSRVWLCVDSSLEILSVANVSETNEVPVPVPTGTRYIIVNNVTSNQANPYVTAIAQGVEGLADKVTAMAEEIEDIERITGRKQNVLVIGNSFSFYPIKNSSVSIFDICRVTGTDVYIEVIGDSACSFANQITKLNDDSICGYHLYGDAESGWVEPNDSVTRKQILSSRNWDWVILHQNSSSSGNYSTFTASLPTLIEDVKLYCRNEHVKIGLQLTWAYALYEDGLPKYPVNGFATQVDFYEAIADCYKRATADYPIDMLIPAGTALQNGRLNGLGASHDDFAHSASDAVHINRYGTVITAMAWFAAIIGTKDNISIGDVARWTTLYTESEYVAIQQCVKNAIKFPYKTTLNVI